MNYIGVLRMDVDDLGDIFSQGLRKGPPVLFQTDDYQWTGATSFARWASLSRQLELFFKFYISRICEALTQKRFTVADFKRDESQPEEGLRGRKVVVVYSGGDDLFLVGAWSDAVELAFEIHQNFKAYTADNPDVDISAGLIIRPPDYPLYHMAEDGKKAIEAAKSNKEDETTRKKASIALFYTSVREAEAPAELLLRAGCSHQPKQVFKWRRQEGASKWATADDVIALVKKILVFRSGKKKEPSTEPQAQVGQPDRISLDIPHGFIRDLFTLSDIYQTSGAIYLPRLAALLARREPSGLNEEQLSTWRQLKKELMDIRTMQYLHPAIVWVDLLCREKSRTSSSERR
jgi:hypothetical protein